MGVRRYHDLIAWQLADALHAQIYELVLKSPGARNDLRYKSQILEAADGVDSNIVEGFLRFSPGDFKRFLDYAFSSLGEAERRLRHGIARGYFSEDACGHALRLARRCGPAIVRLKQSQRKDWRDRRNS